MSGEAFGAIVPLVAVPVVVAGAVVVGIGHVIMTVAEKEKASREAQKRCIVEGAERFSREMEEMLARELAVIDKERERFIRIQRDRREQEAQRFRQQSEEKQRAEMRKVLSRNALENLRTRIGNELRVISSLIVRVENREYREALQREMDDVQNSVPRMDETAHGDEIHERLQNMKIRIAKIIELGHDPIETQRTIAELADTIGEEVRCIPLSYARMIRKEIEDITDSLSKITRLRADDPLFCIEKLKKLEQRVYEAVCTAKNMWDKEKALVCETESRIHELLSDLESVIASPYDTDKKMAQEIKSILLGLFGEKNIGHIRHQIDSHVPLVKSLYLRHVELSVACEERRYILASMKEVLTAMGYDAEPVGAPQNAADEWSYFDISVPGGERLRVGVNNQRAFSARVFHSEDAGVFDRKTFRRQEAKVCGDLALLSSKLGEKGLELRVTKEKLVADTRLDRLENLVGKGDRSKDRRKRQHKERRNDGS